MKRKEILGMQIKMMAFDFDGTLIDTTIFGYQKIRVILDKIGLPPVSDDFLREHWGRKFYDLAAVICHHIGVDGQHVKAFLEEEKEYVSQYPINQEVFSTLQALKEMGFLITMITSRDIDSLIRLSKQYDFNLADFDYVQTPEDSQYHKPDGRVFNPLLKWAARNKCWSENILYFGDTVKYDLAATLDCQPPIKFVGVVSGVDTPSNFLRHQVTDLVYGVNGLPNFLQTLVGLK